MLSNLPIKSYLGRLINRIKPGRMVSVRGSGNRLRSKLIRNFLIIMVLGVVMLQFSGLTLALPDTTATRVYGQNGSFSTNTSSNDSGVSAATLDTPTAVATDSSGGVYIVDFFNSRVLYFASGSTTATRVYGQNGSFTDNAQNNGGVSADSLDTNLGVAVDSTGVYIADTNNNRVLFYPGTSTTASRVYGQLGSFTDNTPNNGGVTADSLAGPSGIAVDSTGVYIADTNNHRILYYAGTSTTATRVYGQNGSFTDNSENNGGISANSLAYPYDVAVDNTGVYIADFYNNRALYYPGTTTTATRVYGQKGSLIDNGENNGGISADSLYQPIGISVGNGGVYIADSSNNRVLYYAGTSTTATQVYGQNGSFTSNTSNNGGISANSLANPYTVSVDSSGNVYIADTDNNRVLYYPNSTGLATTTTLNSSANPSQSGQAVTFTATVSPQAATGSVTFNFDNGTLVNATLSGGTATYITSTLSVGQHPVIATYQGDGSYTGSSSTTLTQTVQSSCTPIQLSVTDGGDSGAGTLRTAIADANSQIANCSVTITLNTATVTINSALPALTNSSSNTLSIIGTCTADSNGRGQPGTAITAGAGFSGPGLNLSNHIALSGVSVTGFQGYGLELNGHDNEVKCSWIGTSDGTTSKGNGGGGILINGSNNSLGTAAGILTGNLISANGGAGLQVSSGQGNQAYYNFIGLSASGNQALSNKGGIKIASGAKLVFHPGNRVKS